MHIFSISVWVGEHYRSTLIVGSWAEFCLSDLRNRRETVRLRTSLSANVAPAIFCEKSFNLDSYSKATADNATIQHKQKQQKQHHQDDGRVEARAEVPHADAGDGRPGVLRDAVETATGKRDGAGMVRS